MRPEPFRPSSLLLACAAVPLMSLVAGAVGGCQPQGPGAIPPPPVSVRDPALVERPGTPASRPVISDVPPAAAADTPPATPGSDADRVNARVQAHLDAMKRAQAAPSAEPQPTPPSSVTPPPVDVTPSTATSAAAEPSAVPAAGQPPSVTVAPSAPSAPDITVGPPAARTTPAVQVSPPSAPPVSVQPAASAASDAAPSPVRGPQSALAAGTVSGGGSSGGVESAVAERLARDPRDVSAALDAQLLQYLREKPAPDAAALAALPTEDRELISAVLDALVNFRAGVRADPNATYAAKSRPLADLADRVRLKSDLAVPVLTFASSATGFGVYEPTPATLSPRGNTGTILYYEVVNFTSRLNDKKLWETRLTQQFTLFDATGKQVWQDRLQSITDTCRNRRTDFFMGLPLRLPPMPAGRYTLKLTLTDLNVGRVAEGVLQVESK